MQALQTCIQMTQWNCVCKAANSLQLQCEHSLSAATHHSSKGWRKKQQPRFDTRSLSESLPVQQTCFTVAVPTSWCSAGLLCLRGPFVATVTELCATLSQTPSERHLELICFQCLCGRTWCYDVISSCTLKGKKKKKKHGRK